MAVEADIWVPIVVGAVTGLAIFCAGGLFGWLICMATEEGLLTHTDSGISRREDRSGGTAQPANPLSGGERTRWREEERQRLREEQEAFRRIQRYTVEDAYGMNQKDGWDPADRYDPNPRSGYVADWTDGQDGTTGREEGG